jgi:SAM-dependent methyltransferase
MSFIKKYADIQRARDAFDKGENVTEILRRQLNTRENTAEIIEIAYDLQAGSYIRYVDANRDLAVAYASELAGIIGKHVRDGDVLLDAGTGEMTTLGLLIPRLGRDMKNIYAFDISWSRVWRGLDFARREAGAQYSALRPFVADIGAVPLRSKSVDVVISSHALEPNGGRERELLRELFRVAKRKLLLCEPCYEINSTEGRERMDRLGYIKGLGDAVRELGGELIDIVKIRNINNPLNPTGCYVIVPPPHQAEDAAVTDDVIFSDPGADQGLIEIDNILFSPQSGFSYPKIRNIPVLRTNAAILTTALDDSA